MAEVWDLFLGASVGCDELFEYGNFIVIIRVFSVRLESAEVSALVAGGRRIGGKGGILGFIEWVFS